MTSVTTNTTPFLSFCIQYASIATVYYDYILTLPLEIKYIWGQKFKLSTFLYILCRYSLIANVLYLLAISNILTLGCDTWYKVIGTLSVMGRAAVIATFTARTYAIYGGSRIILIYLGIIGIVCVSLDVSHLPGLRCVGSSKAPLLDTLLSILMVVFEYSSAILMIVRSIKAFRISRQERRQTFMYLVFKEGVIYFSVVSVFTTGAVILNFCAKGFFQRLLNAFTLPLSGLLTARFLLHLRQWEDKGRTVVSGKAIGADEESTTLPPFQAAPRPGIKRAIVDEFGDDPVATLQQTDSLVDLDPRESLDSTCSCSANPSRGGLEAAV